MKTIVSVTQLSVYRAYLAWCLRKRNEGHYVSPNTQFQHLDISRESVTKLARRETSELFDQASRRGQHSIHPDTPVEFQEPATQVSR